MNKDIITGIVGAGAMGSGIAHIAAVNGHKTIIFDSNENALARSSENIKKTLRILCDKGKMKEVEAARVMSNLHFVNDLSEMKDCGLVIEAIIEDLEAKKQVFSHLEKVVGDKTILATNTSSLSIASVSAACKLPERFIGIHFFNPATIMPLVEIVPSLVTSPDVSGIARKAIDAWGKITVVAKDTPGFIVNRIARPYYGEAIRIYEEGIADFSTIDWVMKEFGGFKMGPFELMDFIGNDVNYKVTESVWQQMFYDPKYKPSLTQKRLFEAGLFGRKTGRGYYNYANEAFVPEPLKDKKLGEVIFKRILSMLINEAADALYYNVAKADDIEISMLKGVNYPKGLLQWGKEFGYRNVIAVMDSLYEDYKEDRYRKSRMLSKLS